MAAETWLCGSVARYYKYPGIPYLKFDGADDYGQIPNATIASLIGGPTETTGYAVEVEAILGQDGAKTVGELSMTNWYLNYGATYYQLRYKSATLVNIATKTSVSDGQYHRVCVTWLPATTQYTVSIDGAPIVTTPTGAEPASSDLTVMRYVSLSKSGLVRALRIYNAAGAEVARYINPGGQNAGGLLPSNPSGANGTLIGGVSWMYNNIARHDETAALTLAAINATTLTGPLLVIDLDGAIPAGYLPTTKDGWPVYISDMGRGDANRHVSIGVGIGV